MIAFYLPFIELTTDQARIVETLTEAEFLEVFMKQVDRVAQMPDRAYNAIVAGKFRADNVTLYVNYHFHPADPGLSMLKVTTTDPEVLALAEKIMSEEYQTTPQLLWVDAPKLRN